MADDMVDRGADRFWIAAIVERCRNGAVLEDKIVAKRVELVGRNPRHNMRADHVQSLGGKAPGGAHGRKVFGFINCNPPGIGPAIHHMSLSV